MKTITFFVRLAIFFTVPTWCSSEPVATPTLRASLVVQEKSCSSVVSLNDGANQAEAVLLSADSTLDQDAAMRVLRLSLVEGRALGEPLAIPSRRVFDVRDVIGLTENSYVMLGRLPAKGNVVKRTSANPSQLIEAPLPRDFYPMGMRRLSVESLVIFGASAKGPSLLFFNGRLEFVRKVVVDKVRRGEIFTSVTPLPSGEFLTTIRVSPLVPSMKDPTTTVARISATGELMDQYEINAPDVLVSTNEAGGVLIVLHEAGGSGQTEAVALGLDAKLKLQWRRMLYNPMLSVARVNAVPIGGEWLIFGSKLFMPFFYRVSSEGEMKARTKGEDQYAAASYMQYARAYGRKFVTAQENVIKKAGNPVEFVRCNGVRIDFWAL